MKTHKGYKIWKKSLNFIEGGTMLYSKNPDRFLPKFWPTYYSKAKGCYIWDLDNTRYTDFSIMSVGTNILGYANNQVNDYVIKQIKKSNISTLNSKLDLILAKELLKIDKWASKVRFAKTGGEILSVAIRIARTYSKKDNVAFCGYHGWHDWYLSSNLQNKTNLNNNLISNLSCEGIPSNLKNTTFPFKWNNIKDFKKVVSKKNIGTVIMEVQRNIPPDKNFLKEIRKVCDKKKIVLIFDECTSGFREFYGGIYRKYGVQPDIVMYGKSLGNGFPISALVGKKNIMSSSNKTFISSTYWTENIGTAAAIKTLELMKKKKSWLVIKKRGQYIKKQILKISKKHKINIKISGLDAMPKIEFDKKNKLFCDFICYEMLKNKFLFKNTVYLSVSHNKKIIDNFLKLLDKILLKLSLNKSKMKKFKTLSDFERYN